MSGDEASANRRLSKRGISGRAWLAGGLLALGGCLVFGISWLCGEDSGHQRQRLPGGSSIELLGFTYGNSHRFLTGPRWQKLLWPLAPPSLKPHLGAVLELTRIASPPRSLVLWMLRRLPSTDPMPIYLEAFNEQGETVLVEDMATYGADGAGSHAPEPWAIDTFPRRGAIVGVRVLSQEQNGKRVSLAEFQIPNPNPGPHPVWAAPLLPVSQKRDGLTISLIGFETRVRSVEKKGPLPSDEFPWTRATFRITREGHPALSWHPNEAEISDATGNRWQPLMASNSSGGPDPQYSFQGTLSPTEVYRLRVEITSDPERGAVLPWQLPAITLPTRRTTRSLPFTATYGKVTVTIPEVLGSGTPIRSSFGLLGPGPHIHVLVTPKEFWSRRVILLRATDQRGRDLMDTPRPKLESTDGNSYFELKSLPGVQTLHLTFGIRRSYFLEFLARPIDATRGSRVSGEKSRPLQEH